MSKAPWIGEDCNSKIVQCVNQTGAKGRKIIDLRKNQPDGIKKAKIR